MIEWSYYHAAEILVGVESRKMFLIAAVKTGIRQFDTTGKIVVEILVVSNRVILPRCIHDFAWCRKTVFTTKQTNKNTQIN